MTYNPPTIIYENNELPLGVRDCFYFEEGQILFLVCCDMNITSRVDAYITNVNLPWEKKTDQHISVGAVFAFKVIEDKRGNSYYFENYGLNLSQNRLVWLILTKKNWFCKSVLILELLFSIGLPLKVNI